MTLLLEHWRLLTKPLLYLSLFFKRHRADYYERLNAVRVHGDWEGWLGFFLDGVAATAQQAVETAQRLLALLARDRVRIAALGGRAAELLVLNDVSTGATSDLQRATEIARSMVVRYGMSDEIGPLFLGGEQELFIGREIGHMRPYSDELAYKVDQEVKKLLDAAFEKATNILKEHVGLLHKLTAVLMEREKIDGEEFEKLWNGEDLPPLHDNGGAAGVPAQAPA